MSIISLAPRNIRATGVGGIAGGGIGSVIGRAPNHDVDNPFEDPPVHAQPDFAAITQHKNTHYKHQYNTTNTHKTFDTQWHTIALYTIILCLIYLIITITCLWNSRDFWPIAICGTIFIIAITIAIKIYIL